MGRFINADGFTSTGQSFLGNNMFAYCCNNPNSQTDHSGKAAVSILQRGLEFALPVLGLLDSATPFLEIAGLLVLGAIAINEYADRTREESITNNGVAVFSEIQPNAFYGADIVGDSTGEKIWRIRTGPMDYETAIAWVNTVSANGTYGRNASWGLYTQNQSDAAQMAMTLGGIGPCLHENRINEYPHYHVFGMILFGQYKHFHVWFGNIYTG